MAPKSSHREALTLESHIPSSLTVRPAPEHGHVCGLVCVALILALQGEQEYSLQIARLSAPCAFHPVSSVQVCHLLSAEEGGVVQGEAEGHVHRLL